MVQYEAIFWEACDYTIYSAIPSFFLYSPSLSVSDNILKLTFILKFNIYIEIQISNNYIYSLTKLSLERWPQVGE